MMSHTSTNLLSDIIALRMWDVRYKFSSTYLDRKGPCLESEFIYTLVKILLIKTKELDV